MIRINIKPLSQNAAYYGRLTKTSAHRKYITDVGFMLPSIKLPDPPFKLSLEFGFSSAASDIDNPVKIFNDIIAKKYGFDDKKIHRIVIDKAMVKKGQEYIKFKIESL